MNADRVFDLAGAIVTVGLITVLVTSSQTANVVKAVGGAFSGSLRAAMGR